MAEKTPQQVEDEARDDRMRDRVVRLATNAAGELDQKSLPTAALIVLASEHTALRNYVAGHPELDREDDDIRF